MSNKKEKVSKKLAVWLVVASFIVIIIIALAFVIFNKIEDNKKKTIYWSLLY